MSRKAEKYFEEVSGSWDALRKSFYGDEVRDAVLAAAKVLPSDTVLDVGAGTGFLTEGAAKIARKVIALDFSETMTGESRMKLGGRNVEFKIGNVEQIPLRDRVLVTGVRLALSDLQQHNYEFLRKEHADRWLGFDVPQVRSMLARAGFGEIRVEALESCCSSTAEHGQVKIPMFLASGRRR